MVSVSKVTLSGCSLNVIVIIVLIFHIIIIVIGMCDDDDDDEYGYDVALHVVRRCGPPRPRRTDEVGMRSAETTPGGNTPAHNHHHHHHHHHHHYEVFSSQTTMF